MAKKNNTPMAVKATTPSNSRMLLGVVASTLGKMSEAKKNTEDETAKALPTIKDLPKDIIFLMDVHHVDTVYGTADGNLWLPVNKQYAIEHAYKTKQDLTTYTRP